MNTHTLRMAGASGLLLAAASMSNATIVGFGNSFGNNTAVETGLGSFAVADAAGYTVSNGATGNIGLTFDAAWDYHHADFFDVIENHTSGGVWDTDGGADVAQTDVGVQTILFTVDAGYALVLNSFDFGLSRETTGSETDWSFTLTDSSGATVWSDAVSLVNAGAGDTRTITPGFTGAMGEDYTLTFTLTEERGGSFGAGRNALDNLSFNQVPTPGAAMVLGMGGLGLLRRRRTA